MSIDTIINSVIQTEGGYVNDSKDSGGETNFGITLSVARANGYTGNMKDMPKQVAYDIYYKKYVIAPGYDKLISLSERIAEEIIDSGVNMGPSRASEFLQRSLNVLNQQGKLYSDITVDGKLGKASIGALEAFLKHRGAEGEQVLLKALNVLQGAFYVQLAEQRVKDETFVYGWLLNRVKL